jgi:hypothetical protein
MHLRQLRYHNERGVEHGNGAMNPTRENGRGHRRRSSVFLKSQENFAKMPHKGGGLKNLALDWIQVGLVEFLSDKY